MLNVPRKHIITVFKIAACQATEFTKQSETAERTNATQGNRVTWFHI